MHRTQSGNQQEPVSCFGRVVSDVRVDSGTRSAPQQMSPRRVACSPNSIWLGLRVGHVGQAVVRTGFALVDVEIVLLARAVVRQVVR